MLIFIYDKLGKDEIPAIKWWQGKNNFYFTEISKNVHVFSKVSTWNLARKKQMKTFIEDLMIQHRVILLTMSWLNNNIAKNNLKNPKYLLPKKKTLGGKKILKKWNKK